VSQPVRTGVSTMKVEVGRAGAVEAVGEQIFSRIGRAALVAAEAGFAARTVGIKRVSEFFVVHLIEERNLDLVAEPSTQRWTGSDVVVWSGLRVFRIPAAKLPQRCSADIRYREFAAPEQH